MEKTTTQLAMRVSSHSFIGNVVLSAFKLFAGTYAQSSAMISDAVHSLSDVCSIAIVMIGVKLANREPDKEHPYGHERFECVAAIVLAAILFVTGAGIGWAGLQKLIAASNSEQAIPGVLALVAAITSILVNEALYWYMRAAAKKIESGALMADAWHHRSDALASTGSFIGILGARLGLPILDPLASMVICLFILKAAMDIFRDAVSKMTDKACDEETAEKMLAVIRVQEAVEGVDRLQTRLFGNKIYVDVEIRADGLSTLEQAHGAAQRVHNAVEAQFPKVKHCMVHVNPVAVDVSAGGGPVAEGTISETGTPCGNS